jgi:uncharacterized membrane protein YoaT (DUF817 family)
MPIILGNFLYLSLHGYICRQFDAFDLDFSHMSSWPGRFIYDLNKTNVGKLLVAAWET